jgi:hypothetical protein
MEYATGGGFRGFGHQNQGGCSEERTARGGIEELASRLSYLMKDIWWPSNLGYVELD